MTPRDELAVLLRPKDDLTVAEWAERHRVLSPENCAMPGPYRLDVTPYLREPLESITDPAVERLVFMKSAQVAWTDGVICNSIGYYIDHEPASMLVLLPTEGMAQRFSKEKLAPMIRDCDALRGKVSDPKSRDSSNTILSKHFAGGHLELVGSNAPSKLSSSPIRIILVEEPDRCSRNTGKEGNSLWLAYERGKTFHNRKIILGGSPTVDGSSEIDREYSLSDKRRFFIPCPCCGEFIRLEWAMVKWDQDPERNHPVFGSHLPETAMLECTICKERFGNRAKVVALGKGEWRATGEFRGTRGYRINELYSPFPKATLKHVVEKFLEAKRFSDRGDNSLMTTFTNTSLAETWKPKGTEIDPGGLIDRGENYPINPLPEGVKRLTCFVDVQQNRLELEIVGWGDGEESWGIEYRILPGDTDNLSVWDDLGDVLDGSWSTKDGEVMRLSATGIDQGYRTDRVVAFTKKRGRCYPCKGYPGDDRPVVDVKDLRKRKYKNSHIPIGTHQGKQIVMERLKLAIPKPYQRIEGYMHIPSRYDPEYWEQLTAERLVTTYRKGRAIKEWELKPGVRNEALDIRVGNLAMARLLGPIKTPTTTTKPRRKMVSLGVQ